MDLRLLQRANSTLAVVLCLRWCFRGQAHEVTQSASAAALSQQVAQGRLLSPAVERYLSRLVPATQQFAEAHPSWGEWQAPTDSRHLQAFKDRLSARMTTLAKAAVAALRARKGDEDFKEELGMLRYCQAKDRLHNTYARINVLEAQAEEGREEVEDLNQSLIDIDNKIKAEIAEIIQQPPSTMAVESGTAQGTAPPSPGLPAEAVSFREQRDAALQQRDLIYQHNQQMAAQMRLMHQYMLNHCATAAPPPAGPFPTLQAAEPVSAPAAGVPAAGSTASAPASLTDAQLQAAIIEMYQ
ncbi:unnamed protein product, partial [Prorocentrum cordatum]